MLRGYLNAAMGFEEFSRFIDKSSKSLMAMFGPKWNPQVSNLFAVIHCRQEHEGYIWKSKPGRRRGGLYDIVLLAIFSGD